MKNRYFELYLTFLKIGSLTFGGGYAMLPMMQGELVDSKKWITEEELLDYYAVGQSTPGIIAVNVATFVGYKQKGILGGIVATLGIITPSIFIITLLAGLINSIDDMPLVKKAMKGINVAVCALITDATLNFIKKTSKGVFSVFLLLLSFSLMYFLNIPSYCIILGATVLGILIHFIGKKASGRKNIERQVEDGQ
ncbi:MAG: chromate transporter [Treponema sp.]|nr:chromate transporter [Treponema sp.]